MGSSAGFGLLFFDKYIMSDLQTTSITTATDAINSQIAGKPFYKAKTFWANIIAMAGMLVQMKYGFPVSIEAQTLVLSVVNLALRSITKDPIVW